MADTPRGRVTITLGRTGQVVKRPGSVSEALLDPMPSAGSKRSVRDRLGSNGDISLAYSTQMSNNKRQRGDRSLPNWSSRDLDDARLDKGDLRNMLIQKNVRRRAESDDERKVADLRQKLVKPLYRPASPPDTRQRIPAKKENGYQMGHPRMPPTRSAGDLPPPDPSRGSYSPWSIERLRRSPPERYSSRARSPPRRTMEEMQRRPVARTSDDVRTTYARSDVLDPPRPLSSTAYMPSLRGAAVTVRPPTLSSRNPPPSGSPFRSSLMVDEFQTVDGLLSVLNLGKYALIFKAEEVDMAALKQMGDHDLKELGIPMGPRKKIIQALTRHRLKRQQ